MFLGSDSHTLIGPQCLPTTVKSTAAAPARLVRKEVAVFSFQHIPDLDIRDIKDVVQKFLCEDVMGFEETSQDDGQDYVVRLSKILDAEEHSVRQFVPMMVWLARDTFIQGISI